MGIKNRMTEDGAFSGQRCRYAIVHSRVECTDIQTVIFFAGKDGEQSCDIIPGSGFIQRDADVIAVDMTQINAGCNGADVNCLGSARAG